MSAGGRRHSIARARIASGTQGSYRKEFCVSKWIWFVNKNSNSNSPWAYTREGLLSERYLRLRFGGLISFFFLGGGGLLSEFYGITKH